MRKHDIQNRCGDCGRMCLAFYCPECTQKRITTEMSKGRIPPDESKQKYGTDQDTSLTVARQLSATAQQVFIINYKGVEIVITLRTAIDLVHKLQKSITDAMIEMMLVFMKGE